MKIIGKVLCFFNLHKTVEELRGRGIWTTTYEVCGRCHKERMAPWEAL